MPGHRTEDLLRPLAPQVLGALVRRYGHFDSAEDATQEALLAATLQWPTDGVPERPLDWLVAVAARRLIDQLRSESARRRREEGPALAARPEDWQEPPADEVPDPGDDTLVLLFLCCHPALPAAGQIALTLRAVGGLTTPEVARAFLVSEATMTRRITRAKQRIKASGVPFALPPAAERAQRWAAVLHVLYLVFNEGYVSTAGPSLHRPDLSAEAVRLARLVHALRPEDGEAAGLLALMLLTDARRGARSADGELVPMAEQDRTRWDRAAITEGVALVTAALPRGRTGPYQLQAAIAALHDEAPDAGSTDWPQILALYGLLRKITDNPVVGLNHAVAVAMVHGPAAGLARLAGLAGDERLARDHRPDAVRAHLLERSGELADARRAYLAAARLTASLPQQRYLQRQAARLSGAG